jgi:hypothetical protein
VRFDRWRQRRFQLGEQLDLERLLIQRQLRRRGLGLQRGNGFELRQRLRRLEHRFGWWIELRRRVGLERRLRVGGKLRHGEQLGR